MGDVAERAAQDRGRSERADELRRPVADRRGQGKWRVSANEKVTAGLKCAPEMWPTA